MNENSVLPLFWKHVFHIYFLWTYVWAEKIKTCKYISKQNPRLLLILGPLIHYSLLNNPCQSSCSLNFTVTSFGITHASFYCFRLIAMLYRNYWLIFLTPKIIKFTSPLRKWRYRSRAKRNTVSTFRWWNVATDRCESFKEIDGQIKNLMRNCFYFEMMIGSWYCSRVLKRNWWTAGEVKEKPFLLCDDDLLLLPEQSPWRKLMDSWRTEGETLATLRWWSVAADGSPSFKDI